MTIQSGMISDFASRNGFSIDRLTTFCSVVEAGSIVAAAGQNSSRQSQFSRQIKELEESLGHKLFHRIGRTMQPTEAGLQLARMTKAFLNGVNAIHQSESTQVETLTVGAGEGVLRWLVVPQLSILRQLSPAIHGYVRPLPTEQIVQEVSLGRLDLGLVRDDAPRKELESEKVGKLSYVLTVPRRLLPTRNADEVFSGRPVPYAELAGGGVFASAAAAVAKEAGIALNRILQADTVSLLLAAVDHEDAVAFLPAPAASSLPVERFALVPFEESKRLDRELFAIWTREAFDQRYALQKGLRPLIRSLQKRLSEFETERT